MYLVDNIQEAVETPSENVKRDMQVVQCLSCHKQSPAQYYNFQTFNLDAKIKCSVCHKSTPLRSWNCNCGVLWYNCKVHSCTNEGVPKLASKSIKSSSSTASPKAELLLNSSFEEILDDDLRVEAKRAKKSLENFTPVTGVQSTRLTASMLPPKLRQRFAHLLQ